MKKPLRCPICGSIPDIISDGVGYEIRCPMYACNNQFYAISDSKKEVRW